MMEDGSESLRNILAAEVEAHLLTAMPAATAPVVEKKEENVDWGAPTNVMEVRFWRKSL